LPVVREPNGAAGSHMLLRGCSRVHCWLCVLYGSSRTARRERRRVETVMALQSRARGGLCWRVKLCRKVGGAVVWKRTQAQATLDLQPTYLSFYSHSFSSFLPSLNEYNYKHYNLGLPQNGIHPTQPLPLSPFPTFATSITSTYICDRLLCPLCFSSPSQAIDNPLAPHSLEFVN